MLEPLVDGRGNPLLDEDGKPVAYFKENPGIVVAFEIRHATDLMKANPIGLRLGDGNN